MLHSIVNNPYRTLGVLSSDSLDVRERNLKRVESYANAGSKIDFPEDFVAIIPTEPLRTPGSVADSSQALSTATGRASWALLWFIKADNTDEAVLRQLQAGNIDVAKVIYGNKETFSSLINLGVMAMVRGNMAEGYADVCAVIHNRVYRRQFLEAIHLSEDSVSEEQLAEMFMRMLLDEIPADELRVMITNYADRTIFDDLTGTDETSEPEPETEPETEPEPEPAQGPADIVAQEDACINSALEQFAAQPKTIDSATTLLNDTKGLLEAIRVKMGADSPYYLAIATTVVSQVLNAIIDIVNHTQDEINAEVKGNDTTGLALLVTAKLKPLLRKAWNAMLIMNSISVDPEFRAKRFEPNRDAIKKMCDEFKVFETPEVVVTDAADNADTGQDRWSGCLTSILWAAAIILVKVLFYSMR